MACHLTFSYPCALYALRKGVLNSTHKTHTVVLKVFVFLKLRKTKQGEGEERRTHDAQIRVSFQKRNEYQSSHNSSQFAPIFFKSVQVSCSLLDSCFPTVFCFFFFLSINGLVLGSAVFSFFLFDFQFSLQMVVKLH